MKVAHPYLNFRGNTEEAFAHYKAVFGGEFLAVHRFRDFGGNTMGVAESELEKIAHIALPLGPHCTLMATDVVESMGKTFSVGNNFYINIEPDSGEEAERLFAALSEGGRIEMPLQQTPWAEKYGCCADKFGVQWMVTYAGAVSFAASS